MNNTVLTDGTVMYYALKVNGKIVSSAVPAAHLLESYRAKLPQDQQLIAEIVTVTPNGQELLLG